MTQGKYFHQCDRRHQSWIRRANGPPELDRRRFLRFCCVFLGMGITGIGEDVKSGASSAAVVAYHRRQLNPGMAWNGGLAGWSIGFPASSSASAARIGVIRSSVRRPRALRMASMSNFDIEEYLPGQALESGDDIEAAAMPLRCKSGKQPLFGRVMKHRSVFCSMCLSLRTRRVGKTPSLESLQAEPLLARRRLAVVSRCPVARWMVMIGFWVLVGVGPVRC